MTDDRGTLTAQLMAAGRAHSTAAVMFHAAVAEHLGLSPTEEKTVELLQRLGPMTAGELARHSGLAANTATYLLDRLQDKGFVRRKPHPDDGRKVIVEVNTDRLAGGAELFADFLAGLETLCAGYSEEQLSTIVHFLTHAAQIQTEATAGITARTKA